MFGWLWVSAVNESTLWSLRDSSFKTLEHSVIEPQHHKQPYLKITSNQEYYNIQFVILSWVGQETHILTIWLLIMSLCRFFILLHGAFCVLYINASSSKCWGKNIRKNLILFYLLSKKVPKTSNVQEHSRWARLMLLFEFKHVYIEKLVLWHSKWARWAHDN